MLLESLSKTFSRRDLGKLFAGFIFGKDCFKENKNYQSGDILWWGDKNKPLFSMTFDDFLGNEDIVRSRLEKILELGEEFNVGFTLFPIATALQKAPDLWLEAQRKGHRIENHTYSHEPLSKLSDDQIRYQINKHKEIAQEVFGDEYKEQLFLRPPYGDGIYKYSPRLIRICQEEGLIVAMWSADSRGWTFGSRTDSFAIQAILNNSPVVPGVIILQHALLNDLTAASIILQTAKEREIQCVTLAEIADTTTSS